MINSDFHIHTTFSTDGTSTPEETILNGIEKGLKTICITDHMDIDWPYNNNEFIFDTDKYFKELSELKSKYADKIDLRIGIELGLRNEEDEVEHISEEAIRLGKLPFDFIIGSTHLVDHNDPYYPEFWAEKDVLSRVYEYYEATLFNAEHYNDYDVYGHLDYIVRYIPTDAHIEQTRFLEIIEATLKAIISKGKGIEINTKAFYSGKGALNPSDMILKFYKHLGGEIITIGSDSHKAIHLGDGFDEARNALLRCGFNQYTIFKDRKPEFIDL